MPRGELILNLIDKRLWFFVFSLLIITPGIIFLATAPGLKPGIDFTGGSSMTLKFPDDAIVDQKTLRTELI